MMLRFAFGFLAMISCNAAAQAADPIGVTATSIKIGGTYAFSGPASAFGNTGKAVIAYVKMINERGGIGGRQIEYIALDDAYSPPKAVEQARKLVEQDEVAFIFGSLGTPTNSATLKYYLAKKVPHAFVMSGGSRFAVPADYPNATTALPSYATEAKVYAKYVRGSKPDGRVGILAQNDDVGKDFISGFKAVYGDQFTKLVTVATYEVTDATIDSQVLNLRSSGAETLMIAATPKFAAQALRKSAELGWKPLEILNVISSSISATLKPAGYENVQGVVTSVFYKDPSDTRWNDDEGMKAYRTFFDKYLVGADINDNNYLTGYNQGGLLEQLLKQCGGDLSRENVVVQMHAIKDLQLPMILPGILANTRPDQNAAFTQLKLQRWSGDKWEVFSDVIAAEPN